ncbi:MAG: ribosome maturation factor RimP [Bernardetiaceae bacterium]
MPDYNAIIQTWFEENISDPSLFLVEVLVRKGVPNEVLIKVDGDQGINIDQCAEISRKIAPFLEGQDWFAGPYKLEVSSPGVGTPLNIRQLPRHMGRTLRVSQVEPLPVLEGILREVSEQELCLELPPPNKKTKVGEQVRIAQKDIQEIICIISF